MDTQEIIKINGCITNYQIDEINKSLLHKGPLILLIKDRAILFMVQRLYILNELFSIF